MTKMRWVLAREPITASAKPPGEAARLVRYVELGVLTHAEARRVVAKWR